MQTGQTANRMTGGVLVEVPIVLRNGRTCACGDLHGVFPRCVGSDWDQPRPAPRRRKPADRPLVHVTQEFFPLPKGRLPRAIPQSTIDACDNCHPVHEAFYYCGTHRRQSVRNVLLARRKSGGVSSLHMMMAEKGFDICAK